MIDIEYGIETVDLGFMVDIDKFQGIPGDGGRAVSRTTHVETLNLAPHLWGRATGKGPAYMIYLGHKPEGITQIRINPTKQKRIFRGTISANLTTFYTGNRELSAGSLNLTQTTAAITGVRHYIADFFPRLDIEQSLDLKRADISTTFTQPDSIAWLQHSQRYLADLAITSGRKQTRTYNQPGINTGLSYGTATEQTVIYSKTQEASRTGKAVIDDSVRIEHKYLNLKTQSHNWLDPYVNGVQKIEGIMIQLDEAYREQSYAGGVVDMLKDALDIGLINRDKFHQLAAVELAVVMFGPGAAAEHLGYSTRWVRELRNEMETLQTQLPPQIRQDNPIARKFVKATDIAGE